MSRLVIFKAPWDELAKASIHPSFPGGGSSDILTQTVDYSDGEPPNVGDRPLEYQDGGHLEASSTRFSPWRVSRVEEYVANTGMEEFSEVVVAYCEYSPLPEEENPWQKSILGKVSVDSFGGDAEAFEEWKRSQEVMA